MKISDNVLRILLAVLLCAYAIIMRWAVGFELTVLAFLSAIFVFVIIPPKK